MNARSEKHRTTITQQTANPRRTSTYGKWLVDCSNCGTDIVPPQDFEADARAIADRHQEIGGFER